MDHGFSGDELTALSPLSGSADALPHAPRLEPGQVFGPYRVERLLGRGGMGEVYECEHVEQGRRLALKVLNQRLASPQDRARFLREGQLAASINHPNSVYIFGSEEILGTPVIAMQLLSGGTLKERVKERGPLPPAEAVDAVLQMIAGLNAAGEAGVLHRDVKPANCFFDRDGSVKIGDFGLSISSLTRDVTQITTLGVFQGTPQFASPEQIRGEALDVRADIYSVGATLYYLLTGQPPFDESNLVALLTRIAADVPKSPRDLQPKVPKGLAAIVLRCLSKDRAQRPPSYAVLEEELRSFGSAAPTPATLGRRFGGWVIDALLLSFPMALLNVSFITQGRTPPAALALVGYAVSLAYYGILEGVFGASLGKRIAGLRVVGSDGQRPGLARGLLRALIFSIPGMMVGLPMLAIGQLRVIQFSTQHPAVGFTAAWGIYVLLAALFLTARRRNGFAGVHELLSRTRVIQTFARAVRPVALGGADSLTIADKSGRRIGPYQIVGSLGTTAGAELLVGNDPSLKRRVWVHQLAPGEQPLSPLIRDLSRAGRLRWLSGRRTATEAWDAYEGVDGRPFLAAVEQPQPWRHVKHWIHDLACEIDAGLREGSLGPLRVDHLWVAADGRVKWLDFPAPGLASPTLRSDGAPSAPEPLSEATLGSTQDFLANVAKRALAPERLPLSAHTFVETLGRRGFPSAPVMVAGVGGLLGQADEVTRWRRVLPVIICTVLPAAFILFGFVITRMMMQAMTPEFENMLDDLRQLTALDKKADPESVALRNAIELYTASQFGSTLADELWNSLPTLGILAPFRPRAQKLLVDHPVVSAEQRNGAIPLLKGYFEKQDKRRLSRSFARIGPFLMAGFVVVSLAVTIGAGLFWALVLRGGLFLRVFGVSVVTHAGARASRFRTLWRAFIAWSPVTALVVIFFVAFPGPNAGTSPAAPVWAGAGLLVLVFVVGVVWGIVRPARGLQDHLAGTWLVPS